MPKILFVIGLKSFERIMGNGVDFSKLTLIIKGSSAGSTKLNHSISPFFTAFIISFGKISIIRLKNTTKIVIIYICMFFFIVCHLFWTYILIYVANCKL